MSTDHGSMCLTVSRARRGCGRLKSAGGTVRTFWGAGPGTRRVAPAARVRSHQAAGQPTWVGAAERLLNMVPPAPDASVCLVHQPSLSVPLSGSG